MTSRPDILLLVLDTQRRDRLSCYDATAETSPNLDAVAADATLFRHAFSTAQWTVPSHASMFTGLYPSVHNTQQSYSILPAGLPTLAERLRNGGYFTAGYCNNPLVGVVNNGLRRGFQSFLNYSGWLTSRPSQAGARPGLMGHYRQFFKRRLAGFIQGVQDSFARSDALLAFAFTPLMIPLWQTALSFKGNTPKSLNDAAQLLVARKGLPADQPVFCFVNLMGTHMPFHPRRPFIEQHAPHMLRDKEAQRYLRRFNSDVFGWLTPIADTMPAQHKDTLDGMYNAEVANQDDYLGVFFERLRSSGALDNTLVIISADHGEMLGEKNLLGHTHSLYAPLTHVPLIIRDPAGTLPRGAVLDDVVSTRRIFHTVLTAAGLADEVEQPYSLAGSRQSDPDGGTAFAEGVTPINVLNLMRKRNPQLVRRHHCDQPRRAVWRAGHKLILTGKDRKELFDFVADPAETMELSDQLPERVDDLHEHLRAFAHQTASSALPAGRLANQADTQLAQRLRALGYLE